MTIIKDGTGTGYTARVDTENRLLTTSISINNDAHVNDVHQKYFSLPFEDIDPAGADDYFFYLENTGIKNLHITDIRISSTVAGTVKIRHVSGTPSYTADTDVTAVNRHLGASDAPTATVKTDTDTTGLTNEGDLFYMDLDTVNKMEHIRTSAHIIIPPGQALALNWDTATGVLSGIVSVYEAE